MKAVRDVWARRRRGAPAALAALAALAVPACRSGPDGPPQPVTYAAIGASDTVGLGAADPEREAWVARVAARLPPGSTFLRLGVPGSTAAEAEARQLPQAEAARPDLATVWLAVNDLAAGVPVREYESHLDRIVGGLGRSGARVFVGNLPDLSRVPAFSFVPAPAVRLPLAEWNDAIARVAGRREAVLVDLTGPSAGLDRNPGWISPDGLHPSSEGHRVLADVFWREISEDPRMRASLRGSRRSVATAR